MVPQDVNIDSLIQRFGRDFRAGDVLFREGEAGGEMFVIQRGRVQVSKRVGDEERPIAMLGRGEFLGEMATDALIQILLHPDPRARVMLALNRHAETDGELTEKGIVVRVSAEDLAREAGSDPHQVGEVLSRLKKMRILAEEVGHVLVIADVGRLLEFMELLQVPTRMEMQDSTSGRSKVGAT